MSRETGKNTSGWGEHDGAYWEPPVYRTDVSTASHRLLRIEAKSRLQGAALLIMNLLFDTESHVVSYAQLLQLGVNALSHNDLVSIRQLLQKYHYDLWIHQEVNGLSYGIGVFSEQNEIPTLTERLLAVFAQSDVPLICIEFSDTSNTAELPFITVEKPVSSVLGELSASKLSPLQQQLIRTLLEQPDLSLTYIELAELNPKWAALVNIATPPYFGGIKEILKSRGFHLLRHNFGVFPLGLGVTNGDDESKQRELDEKVKNRCEAKIIDLMLEGYFGNDWQQHGNHFFLFPSIDLGNLPAPLVAIVATKVSEDSFEYQVMFFRSIEAINLLKCTISNQGYIDETIWGQVNGSRGPAKSNTFAHLIKNVNDAFQAGGGKTNLIDNLPVTVGSGLFGDPRTRVESMKTFISRYVTFNKEAWNVLEWLTHALISPVIHLADINTMFQILDIAKVSSERADGSLPFSIFKKNPYLLVIWQVSGYDFVVVEISEQEKRVLLDLFAHQEHLDQRLHSQSVVSSDSRINLGDFRGVVPNLSTSELEALADKRARINQVRAAYDSFLERLELRGYRCQNMNRASLRVSMQFPRFFPE